MTPAITPDDALARIATYFETLTTQALTRLGEVYAEDAVFKDPFNEVRGLAEIERVYRHMFEALAQPRFVIAARMAEGTQAFLTWDFHFAFRRYQAGQPQCIRGASHLRLTAEGRIALHRDYWDAAEELYEKMPALGGLMRWLRRRAAG